MCVVPWLDHARKGVIYIAQNTKAMNTADMLASLLNESGAYIHVGADNYPAAYVNDGDIRYCVKKVKLFNKETGEFTSEWVNLGEAKQKATTNEVSPDLLAAIVAKLQA